GASSLASVSATRLAWAVLYGRPARISPLKSNGGWEGASRIAVFIFAIRMVDLAYAHRDKSLIARPGSTSQSESCQEGTYDTGGRSSVGKEMASILWGGVASSAA